MASRDSRLRLALRSTDKSTPAQEISADSNVCGIDELISSIDMSLSEEVKNEIDGISEATKRYLESLFLKYDERMEKRTEESEKKLIDKMSSLEKSLDAKDEALADLTTQHTHLNTRVTKIENELIVVRAANEHMIREHDDLQQYGRRTNVRIEGIEYEKNETAAQLKRKIETALSSVGVDIKDDTFGRFHRSGRPYTKNGKTFAQAIVRFRYWEPRL